MKTMTFKQWQQFAQHISARAKRLTDSRMDAAYALAATVGIPRDGCCLHNASIDDNMTGWCAGNPQRLAVAKQANWMTQDWAWEPSRLADRIIHNAYSRVVW